MRDWLDFQADKGPAVSLRRFHHVTPFEGCW
jgi:hypothetical protein